MLTCDLNPINRTQLYHKLQSQISGQFLFITWTVKLPENHTRYYSILCSFLVGFIYFGVLFLWLRQISFQEVRNYWCICQSMIQQSLQQEMVHSWLWETLLDGHSSIDGNMVQWMNFPQTCIYLVKVEWSPAILQPHVPLDTAWRGASLSKISSLWSACRPSQGAIHRSREQAIVKSPQGLSPPTLAIFIRGYIYIRLPWRSMQCLLVHWKSSQTVGTSGAQIFLVLPFWCFNKSTLKNIIK